MRLAFPRFRTQMLGMAISDQPKLSFEERLVRTAAEARERAGVLPPGRERNELLSRAQKCEIAVKINAWLTSPGPQPPD